ncbi:MAG: 23S rRNA (uracil(1939)-C(5))-methyltransferase RlmD [Deltaproteobacteria bacterium]|nr:23S rRNA (uracil(1939)-C(5))-methyltransferase RlmD [Deltaproteobacteria bacterium]
MSTCGYFESGTCRSCNLLNLPYELQLQNKYLNLADAFSEAGLAQKILPVVPSQSLLPSRNKAKMAVGGSKEKPVLGFPGADLRIVDIPKCPILIAPIPEIIATIQNLITTYSLEPYDIEKRTGELKYVLARASETTGEAYVRLVLRSRDCIDSARLLLEKLQSLLPAVRVISVNIQPVPQAIIEGPEEIIFSKQEYIIDEIAGKKLTFSPQSFSQVTSNVAEKLYAYVAQVLRERGSTDLLDLYCGVGAFSIIASGSIERGVGVEISEQAIQNAARSAELNSIRNLQFFAGDVEEFLKTYAERPTAVIVNPPRRGLSDATVASLLRMSPQLLIYSSCFPDTLLRDLRVLTQEYSIDSVQPFDMFPLTSHVETVVVLSRKSATNLSCS